MGFALLVFVLLPLLHLILISNGNVVTINSFECIQGKELCPNMTCSTTMSRNGVHKINCGCLLPRPLYNMTVDLKLQRKTSGHYETFVSTKENMCDVASNTIRSQVMTRIFENIRRYFNSFKCPFEGNVTATNVPVSLSFAPGFMPSSQYRVLVDLRNIKELVMSVELKFSIGKNKFRRRN